MRIAASNITSANIPEKTLMLMTLVSMAPNGAASVEVRRRGNAVFTSTIFLRK